MKIISNNSISFGYKNILKTYYLKGKLPNVTKGFYGGDLTKDTVTLEHILPKSKKGKSTLSNFALATEKNNCLRGNKPLSDFFSKETFEQYCEQFKGVKLPLFDGNEYVEQLTNTVTKLLKQGK